MSDLLLEINNLVIKAGEKSPVNNVSLKIRRQSITGLVGESGSGKTLTALSIIGLLPKNVKATSGSILFYQNDMPSDLLLASKKELNSIRGNRISMIFQEPMTALNPSIRCGIQAMETLRTKKGLSKTEAKMKILEIFRDVKLPDVQRIFRAWPHELSGGQKQRVMIAMAVATSPDLLIADEPTTALDVTVQKSILELLTDLKEKYNLSILFITHDLMVINNIADQVAVMYQGTIVEEGDKNVIMNTPVSAYTKGLLACKPGMDNQPARLPVISDFIDGKPINQKYESARISTIGDVFLTVKNLKVTFGNRKNMVLAVNSVSFDVFRGETLGLVGESGCGKTTLGRTILQLINEESGDIIYDRIPLNTLNSSSLRKIRRKIQIVFQDPYSSLNPGKTVGSIIAEPMVVHKLVSGKKQIEERVLKLLDQVGLSNDALNLYPHEFSGGQRQRIGIARALACQPEFIVLDESVSALDVSVQAQILNLLNDLKEEYNLTYIFISHDLTIVKYMSDRVMVMSEGKIIETGNPQQLYLNPTEEYTKRLIASIPL